MSCVSRVDKVGHLFENWLNLLELEVEEDFDEELELEVEDYFDSWYPDEEDSSHT